MLHIAYIYLKKGKKDTLHACTEYNIYKKKRKEKYYVYVTVHACIAESDISALSWLEIGPVSNLVYFSWTFRNYNYVPRFQLFFLIFEYTETGILIKLLS